LSLTGVAAGLFAAAFALSAIADDDRPDNLFISPCGEPFWSHAGQVYPVVQWFNQVDVNKDGKIDKVEFTADAEAFFKRLDKNGDGTLTSDEIYIYEHEIVPQILNNGQASLNTGLIRASYQLTPDQVTSNPDATVNYDHEGSRAEDASNQAAAEAAKALRALNEGAAFFTFFNDPEPVMSADRNFDFKISHKEFMDQSDRHFARLDTKGAGYLVLADLPRTPAEIFVHATRVAKR
jgi:hypothetical protein